MYAEQDTIKGREKTGNPLLDNNPKSDYNTIRFPDKREMLVEKPTFGELAVFNQIYKEMDETYHLYAKQHGLSDANLWLLYSLYESEALTQKEICSVWHYSPQTINSALKNLEKQGLPGTGGNPRKQKEQTGGPDGNRQGIDGNRHPAFDTCRAKGISRAAERGTECPSALTQKYIKLLQAALHLMDPSLPEDAHMPLNPAMEMRRGGWRLSGNPTGARNAL